MIGLLIPSFICWFTQVCEINELSTAKWDDLRFEPSVNHYFLEVKGKGNKRRDVIIFSDVLEVITENRRRKGLITKVGHYDGTAFFPKYNGSHHNTKYLSNEFTRIVNSAPFDFIQARLKKRRARGYPLSNYYMPILYSCILY